MTTYLQYLSRVFLLVMIAVLTFSLSTFGNVAFADSDDDEDDDVSVSASASVDDDDSDDDEDDDRDDSDDRDDDDEDNSGPGNARDRREELRERFETRFDDGTRIREEIRTRIEENREELRMRFDERRDDLDEQREELRLRIEERRDALTDRREALRAHLETRGEEFRAEVRSRIQDRVGDFAERMIARFRAAIERLENLAGRRIASRIDKLEERGFDLSEASELLVEAEGKIDLAVVAVDDAELALDDLLNADTTATSSVDFFFDARELLSTAKEAIREAHRALVDAIVAIRANVPSDELDDDDDSDGPDDSDDNSDQDEDADVDEFEGTIAAATDTLVTLTDDTTVTITTDTTIETDGDLTTVAGVIDALANGRTVRAEGTLSGSTATTIKFETDE